MNDENLETLDSLTEGEATIDDATEFELPDEQNSADDSEQRIAKAEEIAKNQRLRAEKAEREAKALRDANGNKKASTPVEELPLTPMEAVAFAKADIALDDIETVMTLAKALGVPALEALQNDEVRAVIKVRDEKRKTAAAMNTGVQRSAPVARTAQAARDNVTSGKPLKSSDIEAYLEDRYSNKK